MIKRVRTEVGKKTIKLIQIESHLFNETAVNVFLCVSSFLVVCNFNVIG